MVQKGMTHNKQHGDTIMTNTPTATKYAWDEISDELVKITNPEQQDGDWQLVRTHRIVSVWRSSRGHLAIEIEANNYMDALSVLVRQPEYAALYGELPHDNRD